MTRTLTLTDTLREKLEQQYRKERLETVQAALEAYDPTEKWRWTARAQLETAIHDAIGLGATGAEVDNYTTSLDAAVTVYISKPRMIPSDPLKVLAEALKERIKATENITCRHCLRKVKSPCHDYNNYRETGPWDFGCDVFMKNPPKEVDE